MANKTIIQEQSFGGRIVKKDKRDYKLELVGSTIQIPEVYKPDISHIPLLHQRQIPACGSHAATTLKMIQEGDKSLTPRLHWHEVKKTDGLPLESGMTIYDLLKTLRVPSVCDIKLLENDTTLSLLAYTNFIATPEQYENAKANLIKSFATTFKPTFEQIKQAIYINKAVIVLYRCGQNMYKPSWKECLPLSPNKYPMDSGHFVCAYGYDKDNIYFRNSWGETWGVKGDGYFGKDYVKWVDAIGTAIDEVTPEIVPMTWQQKFWQIIAKDKLVEFKNGKWQFIKGSVTTDNGDKTYFR